MHRKIIYNNWEEISKSRLIQETQSIQERYLELQNSISGTVDILAEQFGKVIQIQGKNDEVRKNIIKWIQEKENLFRNDRYITGISVFNSEGQLLAWTGMNPVEELPPVPEYENRPGFFYNQSDEVRTFLNRIVFIKTGNNVTSYYIIVNRLLKSSFRIDNRFFQDYDFFGSAINGSNEIRYLNIDEHEAITQWEKLFYLNKDLYWGRSGEATRTLTVPLRNLSLEITGYASVTTSTLGEELHGVVNKYTFYSEIVIILSLFILIILFSKRIFRISEESKKDCNLYQHRAHLSLMIQLLLLLWSFRLVFLLFGFPGRFINLEIFRPTAFALDIFHFSNLLLDELFNLYVSPFDLIFTVTITLFSLLIIIHYLYKFIVCNRRLMLNKMKYTAGWTKQSTEKKTILIVFSLLILMIFMIAFFKLSFIFLTESFENSQENLIGSILFASDFESIIIKLSILLHSLLHVLILLIINFILYIVFDKAWMRRSPERYVLLFNGLVFILLLFINFSIPTPAYWIFFTILFSYICFYFSLRYENTITRGSIFFKLFMPFIVPFASILIFSPLLFGIFEKQEENFIERNLVNKIEEQKVWKRIVLQNSLQKFSRDRSLTSKIKNRYQVDAGAIAYALWSRLDSSLKGYNTSLEIRDMNSQLIDRFSINPLFNQHDLTSSNVEDKISIESKWIVYDSRSIEIIVGRAYITEGGEPLAQLLLCYALDYNYIFLPSSRNPYYELFRSKDNTFSADSVFGKTLFLAIFDEEGNYEYSSDEYILPLDDSNLKNLKEMEGHRWIEFESAGKNYKVFVFHQGGEIYLLGFPRMSILDRMLYYSEIVGICFFLALIFLFIKRIIKTSYLKPALPKFDRFNQLLRSSYVKLMIMFILISFIPVFYLSYFSRQHLSSKLSEEVQKRGINSLKVVERYLDFNALRAIGRDPESLVNIITDPLVLDIGKWVNRDLNIYLGRELLATNKQELYYSRLLPTIVNSKTYWELVFAKSLHTVTEERIGDLEYLVVSAAVQTDIDEMPLIITIPLMTEQNRIQEELMAFNRLILLVVVSLVLLFAFVSHSLARYFTRPIQKLTLNAEQIARGNYDVSIDINRNDEIGSLVKSFNNMSLSLERQRGEIFRKNKNLESILKNASSNIITFTPKGKILTINPAAIRLLRLDGKEEKFLGSNLSDLLKSSRNFKFLHEAYMDYLKNPEEPFQTDLRIEFNSDGKNGKEIVANLFITPMLDEKKEVYASLMIIEDATEIIRSQRLEAWAEMARIIAHEIKNPLTPIKLAAEHLQEVVKDKPKNLEDISNECLTTILGQVDVLQQISNDFSRYSKLPQLSAEPIELGKFIEKVVSPYSVAPPEGIEIKVQAPAKTPTVLIDKKLIEQTLINLFQNSFQAMPEGGVLTVKIDYSSQLKNRGVVGIYVIDSGLGINPKILPRIFEPYFTTKDSGVGLGLAIAKKTIEEHQGSIELSSEEGKGTSIKIYLK
ncbi:MAG: HAMP domain-containing protein, partial [Acidobacteria bacterium]|nr:HAMP domain-containing protein [Acidobacteriota bacterium]